MSSAELLEDRVVTSIRPRIAESLRSVSYRCLEHEAQPADLNDGDFYLGGELLLTFERAPLFISWEENAGWETHFSVGTAKKSFFPDAQLQTFDGSSVPVWRPHIGTPLTSAQVLGWDGVPYGILLSFDLGSLIVGTSLGTRLGDGDDLLAREVGYLEELPPLDILWSS